MDHKELGEWLLTAISLPGIRRALRRVFRERCLICGARMVSEFDESFGCTVMRCPYCNPTEEEIADGQEPEILVDEDEWGD